MFGVCAINFCESIGWDFCFVCNRDWNTETQEEEIGRENVKRERQTVLFSSLRCWTSFLYKYPYVYIILSQAKCDIHVMWHKKIKVDL